MGIIIEEENILVYISGYICRKMSRSAYDFDATNKLHTFLSKKQYSVKLNSLDLYSYHRAS